ncbi:hypothetical protein V8G54_003729 [Vigna mungo]|uniref:UBX domain-containing protein n=1 Tax=Vigna mungo TaxID=3915 RepID=A0AAQ3PAZ3_VIGMU
MSMKIDDNKGSASDSDVRVGDGDSNLVKGDASGPTTGTFGLCMQAKDAASLQNKWLLVNIQSTKEFSSHMLNRDTWANEAVSQTISTNCIFWQVYDDTTEGRKVCTYYRLDSIPVVLVIDPITGQKMRSWIGMVEPESLLEGLLAFLDAGPKDHHITLSHKRPRGSSSPPKSKGLLLVSVYIAVPRLTAISSEAALACRSIMLWHAVCPPTVNVLHLSVAFVFCSSSCRKWQLNRATLQFYRGSSHDWLLCVDKTQSNYNNQGLYFSIEICLPYISNDETVFLNFVLIMVLFDVIALVESNENKEEDEEIQRALAASMESMKESTAMAGTDNKDADVVVNGQETTLAKRPTYPPLPEEPKAERNLLCRVGVRLPGGQRVQRNFLRTDPIQLLWSFICTQLGEDETRPFRLTHAIPGASKNLDYESNSTFQESGLANSMISVTWD